MTLENKQTNDTKRNEPNRKRSHNIQKPNKQKLRRIKVIAFSLTKCKNDHNNRDTLEKSTLLKMEGLRIFQTNISH